MCVTAFSTETYIDRPGSVIYDNYDLKIMTVIMTEKYVPKNNTMSESDEINVTSLFNNMKIYIVCEKSLHQNDTKVNNVLIVLYNNRNPVVCIENILYVIACDDITQTTFNCNVIAPEVRSCTAVPHATYIPA